MTRPLFFFFAGHGYYSRSQSNLLLLTNSDAVDCKRALVGISTPIERTAIGVEMLKTQMAAAKFEERYAFLDACRSPRDTITRDLSASAEFSGFDPEKDLGATTRGRADASAAVDVDPPEVVLFYGTRKQKVSREWDGKDRGYFSYYLQQGLRRNLPLGELGNFVARSVSNQTKDFKCKNKNGEWEKCPQEPLMVYEDLPATTVVLGP